MRFYMITNRRLFAGSRDEALDALRQQVVRWSQAGLEFIQLREKDLHWTDLQEWSLCLGQAAGAASRNGLLAPRILVNVADPLQIRVASRVADGVHLPASARPLAAGVREVREIWSSERPKRPPLVSVSCHTVSEVEEACREQVSVILFAPVFEKPIWEQPMLERTDDCRPPQRSAKLRLGTVLPGTGLEMLQAACLAAGSVPVFALGGVTAENAAQCVAAGAVGIAGIRLFMR